MVAKIITGKSIKGAMNYNERKVEKGTAVLLAASGFPCKNLSFTERLMVFQKLTELNQRTKTNCTHISLNFDPKEKPGNDKLYQVSMEYLERIGFGGQPFLLYKHLDAAHDHVHIVTTNIKANGERISLHNIGREKSEKARKEVEKMFGLVPAEANKQQQLWKLKPVAEKIIYGKIETKTAISNTVRAVTRDYTFTSLAELNAVLKGFNVTAYRGEEGSKMYEKKGLTYSVIDKKGNRTGVPIKASSIYSKPTLKNLERYFIENREKRKPYKQRLKGIIDKALHSGLQERFALQSTLKKESIEVIFRENGSMVYGITFIDHAAKTVFNGSDLGKDYTAKRILERLGESGRLERLYQKETEEKIGNILSDLDYSKGIQGALKQLYEKGLSLDTIKEENNSPSYFLSYTGDGKRDSISAGKKLSTYFQANGVTNDHCEKLNEYVESNGTDLLQSYIEALFAQQYVAPFGRITPDKKKHKRKVNW